MAATSIDRTQSASVHSAGNSDIFGCAEPRVQQKAQCGDRQAARIAKSLHSSTVLAVVLLYVLPIDAGILAVATDMSRNPSDAAYVAVALSHFLWASYPQLSFTMLIGFVAQYRCEALRLIIRLTGVLNRAVFRKRSSSVLFAMDRATNRKFANARPMRFSIG